MDFYKSDKEAGLITRDQHMSYLVEIDDYNNGCIPIALNLYFNAKIFTGTADLLPKNGHLFQDSKLGPVREHDDRYNQILAKEIKYENKIFLRNFVFRQNLRLNKVKIDEKISISLDEYEQLIVDISFYNEEKEK